MCDGDGEGKLIVKDTRRISCGAVLLYAGVSVGKDGIRGHLEDRTKARELIGHHLSLFDTKLTLKGDAENPLVVLLGQISGGALKPVVDAPLRC